jgi:murein L,D-transpeptidase YafK
MRTHLEMLTLAALAAVLFLLIGLADAKAARAESFLEAQRHASRFREAEAQRLPEITAAFRDAGALWPPRGLYLRAFKREGEVELWAQAERGARRVRVRTFDICRASGVLGPKRFSGDLQVPEGHYAISAYNPHSRYHLALKVSYPNAEDRRFAADHGLDPGGDIMIHGDCVTIGCLPLRDGPIEFLYVAAAHARASGAALPVDIHPCRYGTAACQTELARHPVLQPQWARLALADAGFETTGRPPGDVDRM